jgi:hypothetical protein
MNNYPRIPDDAVPVVLTPPVTTTGGVTTDFISLKNAHMVFILAVFTQAVAHATGIDPTQSTVVAGTDAKAITATCPIWYNADISATSVLTRGTDAITQNCANTAKNQVIIMQIDPAGFDQANGFDVLGMTVDDSSQATNFVSITAYVVPRYKGVNFIVD